MTETIRSRPTRHRANEMTVVGGSLVHWERISLLMSSAPTFQDKSLSFKSIYVVELAMKVSVTNSFGTTSLVVTHVKLRIRLWNALSRAEIPLLNPASFRPSNAGRVSHKYPQNPRASSFRGRHYGTLRVVSAM